MVLGFLLQLLLHAAIEIWYIGLLLANFPRYSLGLSWEGWRIVHHVGTVVLFIGGIWGGYVLGVRWWQIVYIERKHWWLGRHAR